MANENGNGDATGGLSPSGRFARMESSLDRIEEKLDNKAELLLVQQLTIRVSTIENTALTAAAVLVATKEATASAVLVASKLAQDAVSASAKAAEDRMVFAQRVADKRYRFMLWVVAIFTVASIGYNIVRMFLGGGS